MRTFKILLVVSLFSGGLLACQKAKLSGDSAILIGKWSWLYSIKEIDTCDPPSYTDTLTPGSENTVYDIEWMKKRILLKKNFNVLEDEWFELHFSSPPNLIEGYDYSFTAYLKGNSQNFLSGIVGEDTLRTHTKFPFQNSDCENYTSYFVRQ